MAVECIVTLSPRSVSGQAMFERSSASVDRETGAEAGLRSKRTASAHGLNMSAEGRTGHWWSHPRPRHKYRNLPHRMVSIQIQFLCL